MKILRYIKVEDYTNGEREYIAWRNVKNGGITKGITIVISRCFVTKKFINIFYGTPFFFISEIFSIFFIN